MVVLAKKTFVADFHFVIQTILKNARSVAHKKVTVSCLSLQYNESRLMLSLVNVIIILMWSDFMVPPSKTY